MRISVSINLFHLLLVTLLSLLLSSSDMMAQSAGRYTYQFLTLPASARITALGGSLIAVSDDDINLASSNPASLNKKTDKAIAFNHDFHFAGISNGHIAFGKQISKWKLNTQFAISYANYGEFTKVDEYDVVSGTFKASDKAVIIGASRMLNDRITAGINLKGIFSQYEDYSSTGVAADLGLTYTNNSNFILALVIKNLGTEISTYHDQRYGAPLDIQIGLSKRLAHLPFRFSLTAHQLQQWDITYDDPNATPVTDFLGNEEVKSALSQSVDNLFRHLIFSGEFLLGKKENLRLRAGYNHLRRKELSLSNFRSLAGFSLGFGVKVNRFRLDYGVGYHHVDGAVNHLSISTNINYFKKSLE